MTRSATAVRPNVLLIVTDQQRWDTVGCYGNKLIETANLDWLAAEGTVFSRAYSSAPACGSARASLMTGMDQRPTGIGTGNENQPCSKLSNTLPEALAGAGYHTQGIGKMHFTPQRSLQGLHDTVLDEEARDPGFVSDYALWFEQNKRADYGRYDHGIDQNSWLARPYHLREYLHATNWTATESIRFLQRRDPTRPFFLMTSFARPHSPYDPPAVYFDRYADTELPTPVVGDWVANADASDQSNDPNAWSSTRTARDVHRARAGYYGSVDHIDDQVGRIMHHLRDAKLNDNTVVVFSSDHGDMLGDHDLWRDSRPYEGATHIPLIIRLPRSMRDQIADRVDAPVCLQDIMPTVLDAVGVEIPDTVTGMSMLPLITGSRASWREFVHGGYSGNSVVPAVQYLTDKEWKYIRFPNSDVEQLFNLAEDPYETEDLASDPAQAEELRTWRRRLAGVLEPRTTSFARDGAIQAQMKDPPISSPHAVDQTSPGSRHS